jgi:hypothetical protein
MPLTWSCVLLFGFVSSLAQPPESDENVTLPPTNHSVATELNTFPYHLVLKFWNPDLI